jgi:hypothetical protein
VSTGTDNPPRLASLRFLGIDAPLRIQPKPRHKRRYGDDRVRIDGTHALIMTHGFRHPHLPLPAWCWCPSASAALVGEWRWAEGVDEHSAGDAAAYRVDVVDEDAGGADVEGVDVGNGEV